MFLKSSGWLSYLLNEWMYILQGQKMFYYYDKFYIIFQYILFLPSESTIVLSM